MKKTMLLIPVMFLFRFLAAQDITLDQLPEPVRLDLQDEEMAITNPMPEDVYLVNSEERYYQGLKRTFSTDTIYYFKWDHHADDWRNHHRVVKTYDDSQLLVSTFMQYWSMQGEWVNGTYREFLYTDGLLTEVTIQIWHKGMQEWRNFQHKQFTYNENQQRVLFLMQRWHNVTQSWIDKYKEAFVYEGENLIADTTYHWKPALQEWKYLLLNEIYYDDQGFKSERITKKFNPEIADWTNFTRALFETDPSGQLQEVVLQHWHHSFSEWKNEKKVEFTYDDNGNITERLVKEWFPEMEDWANRHRHLFTYDINGNVDTMLAQAWIPNEQTWMNQVLDDFEFNESGTLLSRLTQHWMPCLEEWINFRLMQLVIDMKNLVAGSSPLAENKDDLVLKFQNPYTGNAPVSLLGNSSQDYSLRLFSINGEVVYQADIRVDEPVKLDGSIASGLYVINVSDGRKSVISEKIIISR